MNFKIKDILSRIGGSGNLLAAVFVVCMIIPNVELDITEPMPWPVKVANILLPLSFWLLCTSLTRKIGKVIWCLILFIAFDAFQIVVHYLFGDSIVAIDMILNVFTTSVGEAASLLTKLWAPMSAVILIYVSLLVWAAVAWAKGRHTTPGYRRFAVRYGCYGLAAGLSFVLVSMFIRPDYKVHRGIFPVNVCCNTVTAVERYSATARYLLTSRDFRYNARDTHTKDDREIHLIVIGETSRALNWELNGYERSTNPKLSRRRDVNYFDRALSQSNTTHKCVPMIFSPVEAETFDSIDSTKSILTAFSEAGYHTAFFTTQPPNHSYTQFFSEEADTTVFLDGNEHPDMELVDLLRAELADTTYHKVFAVLHTYGSHFVYNQRYPGEMARYTPDNCEVADLANRPNLINAYDNTIVYTDAFLNELMDLLEDTHACCTITYSPDHGEDIFDDYRCKFLHASPAPTFMQLYVPLIVWTSSAYDEKYPDKHPALHSNIHKFTSGPVAVFHTVCDLSGLSTPYFDPRKSLASSDYVEPRPVYLDDYNETVDVYDACYYRIDRDRLDVIIPR